MKVAIFRTRDNGRFTIGSGTISDVEGNILFNFKTLEPPFKGNQHNVSCIPAGDYKCVKVPATVNIPYEHFEVLNVPNRSGILIHVLNYVSQTQGCIGVGHASLMPAYDKVSYLNNSADTLKHLLSLLPNEFDLIINYKN